VLSVPLLRPCLRSEQLLVAVDTHSGLFMAHVPQYADNPFTADIQAALNEPGGSESKLRQLITQLRFWMTKRRVRKTLQQLPATPHDVLPLIFDSVSQR
jgi:mediator of RNA polymerase II transcription subunit 14